LLIACLITACVSGGSRLARLVLPAAAVAGSAAPFPSTAELLPSIPPPGALHLSWVAALSAEGRKGFLVLSNEAREQRKEGKRKCPLFPREAHARVLRRCDAMRRHRKGTHFFLAAFSSMPEVPNLYLRTSKSVTPCFLSRTMVW